MRRFAWSLLICLLAPLPLAAEPAQWSMEWPDTDFGHYSVQFDEIMSGGPPKNGIPSIDGPGFVPVAEADLADDEPVIGLVVEGDARAYPPRILIWHEIVNDIVGGTPVAVTYCPLCNTWSSAGLPTVGKMSSTRSTSPSPATPSTPMA